MVLADDDDDILGPGANAGEPHMMFSALQRPLLCATISYVHRHIKHGAEEGNRVFRLFHEEQYHKNLDSQPHRVASTFRESVRDGSVRHIASFILSILHSGVFNVAEFIISVYYLAKFKESTGVSLHVTTWRPLFITSLLIADKMWEDRPVKNSSLSKLFPVLGKADLFELEIRFLVGMDFNVLIDKDLFRQWCEMMLKESVIPEISVEVANSEYVRSLEEPECCKMDPMKKVPKPEIHKVPSSLTAPHSNGTRASSQPCPGLRSATSVKNLSNASKAGSVGGRGTGPLGRPAARTSPLASSPAPLSGLANKARLPIRQNNSLGARPAQGAGLHAQTQSFPGSKSQGAGLHAQSQSHVPGATSTGPRRPTSEPRIVSANAGVRYVQPAAARPAGVQTPAPAPAPGMHSRSESLPAPEAVDAAEKTQPARFRPPPRTASSTSPERTVLKQLSSSPHSLNGPQMDHNGPGQKPMPDNPGERGTSAPPGQGTLARQTRPGLAGAKAAPRQAPAAYARQAPCRSASIASPTTSASVARRGAPAAVSPKAHGGVPSARLAEAPVRSASSGAQATMVGNARRPGGQTLSPGIGSTDLRRNATQRGNLHGQGGLAAASSGGVLLNRGRSSSPAGITEGAFAPPSARQRPVAGSAAASSVMAGRVVSHRGLSASA